MSLCSKSNRRIAAVLGMACLVFLQIVLPASLLAQSVPGTDGKVVAGSPDAATAAGFLSSFTGIVFILRGNGKEEVAKVGDVYGPNTTFRTGSDSTAVLVFADGQSVTLSAESVFRVDAFRFDTRDVESSRASFGLMSGVMRLVTGGIHTGNPNGLVIAAGNASIEILSKDVTAFVVEVDPKSLGVGAAAVTVGEISIETSSGLPMLVSADQFTRWLLNVPPSFPVPLSAAPAIFQALVAASTANVVPSNAPIDVLSASVRAAFNVLPSISGGSSEQGAQPPAPESSFVLVLVVVTPGGGRGCVGSPC